MNPAYTSAHFRTRPPAEGLPVCFGIVTACNPDGIDSAEAVNQEANLQLQARLLSRGWLHFPVTGGSQDFTHAEPGFGIVTDRAACLALGRDFRQEAVFWIEHGHVYLCPCSSQPAHLIGRWADLATET